jgi:hypothetical protein
MPAIRLNVSKPVHDKLRILAAESGLPMSKFMRRLAENAVKARFPEVFGEPRKRKRKARESREQNL